MKGPGLILFAFLSAVSLPSLVLAQGEHQHDRSAHEHLGEVKLRVSCIPAAQKQFNRAVALLHSFEYAESERGFIEVSITDPNCAMAHWGRAMTKYHQLWAPPSAAVLKEGADAVTKAKQVGAKTKRERDYIDAIAQFYEAWDHLDHPTRASRYERSMQRLYLRYPKDREAGIFYALALNASAMAAVTMDKTYAKQQKGAAILNLALRAEPEHPGIVHYLIHSYDYPALAEFALDAARSYARIAPSSAHALHMPSHIFTRLGLWSENIATNIRSENAAKEYARRNHLKGAWDEQLHAMDYLAYAYLQQARDREAHSVLSELKAIRKTDPENFKCAYAYAAVPARWALERRKWSEAAALKIEPLDFPWPRFQFAEAIIHFARAIGAARSGDTGLARAEVAKLDEIRKSLAAVKDNYDWATQVEIQKLAAEAWTARAESANDDALRLMSSAARLEDSTEKHPVTPGAVLPSRELLADMLLELGRPAEALKEYEASLKTSPNRFNGLYGAARAASLSGNKKRAKALYAKLVAVCDHADSERPELVEAKAFLAAK
jgi:hypothetical protein